MLASSGHRVSPADLTMLSLLTGGDVHAGHSASAPSTADELPQPPRPASMSPHSHQTDHQAGAARPPQAKKGDGRAAMAPLLVAAAAQAGPESVPPTPSGQNCGVSCDYESATKSLEGALGVQIYLQP